MADPKPDKKPFNGKPFDSLLATDPRIKIIGKDTDRQEAMEHPLWDERAFLPPDPVLVASMKSFGFQRHKPVVLVKDGPINFNVADGRRRLTAARHVAEGDPGFIVHFVLATATDDLDLMGIMIMGNAGALEDDYFQKAAKAKRVIDKAGDKRGYELCSSFWGVDPMTIRGWLKLNGATEELREAVRQDKVAMSTAQEIADLDRGEQKKFLRENVGKITLADAKRKVSAAKNGGVAPAPKVGGTWPRQAIRQIVDASKKPEYAKLGINSDWIAAFTAQLGETPFIQLPESIRTLIDTEKIKLRND